MRQAMKVLLASGLENDITVLRTEYPGRDLLMIDVINRECSKGHAVERWSNYRGIRREQVMAIGDNYNDVEMLAFAGVPFIMDNAAEDMRRDGWRVTRSNAENGVAAAIEQVLGATTAHGG
jgi:hydroxymethylpyrimidine pyrophosphatase-like HAD family hydrolase